MAADLVQNEPYYNQNEFTQYPWDKIKYSIEFTESILASEPNWGNSKKLNKRSISPKKIKKVPS